MSFQKYKLNLVAGIGLAISIPAIAQMPPVLVNDSMGDRQQINAVVINPISQLESIMKCEEGTNFAISTVGSQLELIGLKKRQSGNRYLPVPNSSKPKLWGEEIVAAEAYEGFGDKVVVFYFKEKTGWKMWTNSLRNFGVNEEANTTETSYKKKTGTRTTLYLNAPGQFVDIVSEDPIKYRSQVTCVLKNQIAG